MPCIRKRNGKWQVQVRRKSGFSKSATFSTRRDAERWAVEAEREAERGHSGLQTPQAPTPSLKALCERYIAEIIPLKRSAYQETQILKSLILERFARLPADKVLPRQIADYRDRRLQEVSSSTLLRSLGVLSHVFQTARLEWGHEHLKNPVKSIRKPKPNPARNRRLADGEWDALSAALGKSRNDHLLDVVIIALETGMRLGEIMSLRWNFIDLDARTALLPMTKNGRQRVVPLSKGALEVLRVRTGLVRPFPTTKNAIQLAWHRSVRRAGIQDLHFHDLRHEAVSRLFEKGLALPEVALVSGHSDPRQLMRYTHMVAARVAEKLG